MIFLKAKSVVSWISTYFQLHCQVFFHHCVTGLSFPYESKKQKISFLIFVLVPIFINKAAFSGFVLILAQMFSFVSEKYSAHLTVSQNSVPKNVLKFGSV